MAGKGNRRSLLCVSPYESLELSLTYISLVPGAIAPFVLGSSAERTSQSDSSTSTSRENPLVTSVESASEALTCSYN